MDSIRMTDAGREARNRYNREWYAANKEKRAAINKRYWEKRAAKLAAEKAAARSAEKEVPHDAKNEND